MGQVWVQCSLVHLLVSTGLYSHLDVGRILSQDCLGVWQTSFLVAI